MAPAPAPDTGTAAAAQGPTADLPLSTGTAPGAEPSSKQVATADGGTEQLQGAATDVSQQHANENGGSHVNITLSGLPANYSDVTAACAFPPLADVQRLETLSLQARLPICLAELQDSKRWSAVARPVTHTCEVMPALGRQCHSHPCCRGLETPTSRRNQTC